jgi:hypothetical protein
VVTVVHRIVGQLNPQFATWRFPKQNRKEAGEREGRRKRE